MSIRRARFEEGFTLVEVLLAMLLLATAAVAVAHLFVVSLLGVRDAREETAAALLAIQKVEELQGAESGALVLAASPADSLDVDAAGYVEEIDAVGHVLNGSTPGAAVFLRRWSVQPLSLVGPTAIVIRVRVTTFGRAGRHGSARPRAAGEARVTTVRARR